MTLYNAKVSKRIDTPMRTALILLICFIVHSIFIVPVLAQQQSTREKAGLIGPVRTIIEKISSIDNKCFIFSHTTTYDIQGRLAESEVAFPHPCEPNTEVTDRTLYTYDDKGASYGTSYKDGRVRSTSLAIFDSNGRPTEYSTRNSQGHITFRSTHRYDDFGNRIETIIYAIGGEIYTRSLYTYETESIAKIENVITYKTDGSLDYTSRARYDNTGRMLEEVFSRVEPIIHERRTYVYNENGQEQEKVIYNSKGVLQTREFSAYEYDSVGNWTKKSTQKLVSKDGNLIPESTWITERLISYH